MESSVGKMKSEEKSFRRTLSVRMKKVFSKQEKRERLSSSPEEGEEEKTKLKRSLTNPESVMERRRQQNKLAQAQSSLTLDRQELGPIIVKIQSDLPNKNVPLLVIKIAPNDSSEAVIHNILVKYGFPYSLATDFCLVHQSGFTHQTLGSSDLPFNYVHNFPDSSLHLRKRHFLSGRNPHHGSVSTISEPNSGQSSRKGSLSESQDWRAAGDRQEEILPAVLEFSDETEHDFFSAIITQLDPTLINFKLAPAYILYMATRFRASTLYRPDIIPEVRAMRLTHMLTGVSRVIADVIQSPPGNLHAPSLAFWLSNTSEFLHFLRSDKHVHSYALEAQEVLTLVVQKTFFQLVKLLQSELNLVIPNMISVDAGNDQKSSAGIISVLNSVMTVLRRCRVNASLTIQLFSHLFHHINRQCFNLLLQWPDLSSSWGGRLVARVWRLQGWAQAQGLELAAECHLARLLQAAELLQAPPESPEEAAHLSSVCCSLNSLQVSRLLAHCPASQEMVGVMVRAAQSSVDSLQLSQGRKVELEEPPLHQPLLIPRDNYSSDIMRGVPSGLAAALLPLQQAGLCHFSSQPGSSGHWNIYMDTARCQQDDRSDRGMEERSDYRSDYRSDRGTEDRLDHRSVYRSGDRDYRSGDMSDYGSLRMRSSPELETLVVEKERGLGLSIVAARGGSMSSLGILVKSVVEGGAADRDGRLRAGDQLVACDGQSLLGVSQERAAELMTQTGPRVSLTVARGAAQYYGLSHLLAQPSPRHSPEPTEDNYINQQWLTQEVQYQNLTQAWTPRPLSLHLPPSRDPPGLTLQTRTLSSSSAQINSGRFRPIQPAGRETGDKLDSKTVIRKGPIRKDGSVVLSPKPSPAPSMLSNSSDKENVTLADDVFVSKEVDQINTGAKITGTLPRPVKKVSFQAELTQEISRDVTDASNNRESIEQSEGPEQFIDEAATLMGLNRMDLNSKSSVVGTQVNNHHKKIVNIHCLCSGSLQRSEEQEISDAST